MSTMASPPIVNNSESTSKFLETLQSDLKVLASETKKKYPQIREVRKTDHGNRNRLNFQWSGRVGKSKRVFSLYLDIVCSKYTLTTINVRCNKNKMRIYVYICTSACARVVCIALLFRDYKRACLSYFD